jgi:hypothetical protein
VVVPPWASQVVYLYVVTLRTRIPKLTVVFVPEQNSETPKVLAYGHPNAAKRLPCTGTCKRTFAALGKNTANNNARGMAASRSGVCCKI